MRQFDQKYAKNIEINEDNTNEKDKEA